MERVIGIDLGTTNSVVAYYEQGQTIVIPNSEGSNTTPSVVLFRGPDDIIVGDLAKRQQLSNPDQTVYSVKRFMGARYSELGNKLDGIHYKVVAGPGDSVLIDVGWAKLTPEQVAAEVLRKMKRTAEDYFSADIDKAVVTVPAYFNDNQRQATKAAGEMAGLEIIRIINEPTAAALAFGIEKKVEQRVAVFDFGGGTFDLSVLELDRDVCEVRSTRGDTFLGGDNIDQALVEHFSKRFFEETGIVLQQDLQAAQRLREACEKVKRELSTAPETVLSLPFVAADATGARHMTYTVKREEVAALIEPLLPRIVDCCREAIRDSGYATRDLTHVLLVGGSTRIPAVQELVRSYFGCEPNRSLNPDEAVAVGAAIQGSILTGGLREVLLLDVTPLSLGIELAGGVFSTLIPRNSSIPTVAHKTFTTVRDNQAVVKIHVLQGERKIAEQNHSLGYFKLMGIAPAPREIPEIDVSFQIDANGLLNVTASDAMSGVRNSITIESYARVSADEAEEMVHAAEEAAEEDRAFVRRKYLRSKCETVVGNLQVVLKDQNNPLDEETRKRVAEVLFRYDIVASREDVKELEAILKELDNLTLEFGDRFVAMRLEGGE